MTGRYTGPTGGKGRQQLSPTIRSTRPIRPTRRVVALTSVSGAALAGLVGVPALAGSGSDGDLDAVRGVLQVCGDELCVDGLAVDFGPEHVLRQVVAQHDLDGDGAVEVLADEVTGLVGSRVLVEVRDGGDADVQTLNGMPYRTPLDAEVPAARSGDEPSDGEPSDGEPPDGEPAAPSPADKPPADEPREDGVELVAVSGTLEQCGTGYCIGDEVIDFGPRWWLQITESREDLDGDGAAETLALELAGLVGSHVTVEVERGRSGEDADVHTVNGFSYRGGPDGPPPWAEGPRGVTPGPPGGNDAPPGPPEGGAPPEGVPPVPPGPPEGEGPPEGVPPVPPGPPEGEGPPEGVPPGPPEGERPPEGVPPVDPGPPEGGGPPDPED
jgi:hypothetical protein